VNGAPVRRLGTADLPDCVRLAVGRGWLPEEHKWRLLFEVGEVYGVDDPGGGLAATVVATRYGTEATAVSMMLVAAHRERQGLGGRLLTHALDAGSTTGALLSATEYGRPLYQRLGFTATGRLTVHLGERAARHWPADAPPRTRTRPAEARDLPALLSLDTEAFGAPRTALVSRLPSFCERLRVADGPTGPVGFGGAWRNTDHTVLGPVVAPDPDTALALLDDLAADVRGPLRLEVGDLHRPALTDWAARNGLTERFSTTAMVRGPLPPGRPELLFAPVMLALG
jgi:GNAT superfamily N-acetyltransferase